MTSENRSFKLSEIGKLGEAFQRYLDIRAVYLFGSAASGKAGPESDIGLAVIPIDPSAKKRKLDILKDLAQRGYCNADLVFIDKSDLVLAYEVIRQNRLSYATGDFDRGFTYSSIVRRYLDVDRRIVYEVLQHQLEDLRRLKKAFTQFL